MKIPGPDHPIIIAPHPRHVRVMFNGTVVADTRRALALRESTYPVVLYIPRHDVDANLLERTGNVTHCPYKGAASYYAIKVGDKTSPDAVWSYEAPFAAVAEIAGHLAFYRNRVDAIDET